MYSASFNRQVLQSAVLHFFLAEEFNFEQVVIPAGSLLNGSADFPIGTVLGQIKNGAVTVAAAVADGGNTGNGTCALGAPAYDSGAQAGTYTLEAVAATRFNVIDPAGKVVGEAKTGVAFANQIHFTLTAGATPFAAGDQFAVAVSIAAGSGEYVPHNESATDGSQIAAAVVMRNIKVDSANDTPVAALVRGPAVVIADNLVWKSGISGGGLAAGLAALSAAGIIPRNL